jgi:glycosyltransferase involved in cell wall biosynthesis
MRDAGLDVRYVPLALTDKLHWWRYHRAQRALRRVLQEVQPDVVHANDLPTSQMVGQAAGQLGIPRVCHHRWVFSGSAIDWLSKFGAEQHVFVSRALKNQLSVASPRLADSPRAVIYDGLALPALPSEGDRQRARRHLGLAQDRQIVLFSGQVIERKGVEDLLHAWKMLSAEWTSRADLLLVGDDLENDGRYRLCMEAVAAKLHSSARFVGFQRNVYEWITAADICVVPSHVEPLGNATIEAMAHGRPMIGSSVGGIPEMIVDGETGILVPPHDPTRLGAAIQRLLGDSELQLRLGQAARRRCEARFSLQTHVEQIVSQYQRLLTPTALARA